MAVLEVTLESSTKRTRDPLILLAITNDLLSHLVCDLVERESYIKGVAATSFNLTVRGEEGLRQLAYDSNRKDVRCVVIFTTNEEVEHEGWNTIYKFWRKHFPKAPIVWFHEDPVHPMPKEGWDVVLCYSNGENPLADLTHAVRKAVGT